MDDFIDYGRLGSEDFVIRLFFVGLTLNDAVEWEIIVDPHFYFTLAVQSAIEFANRNRRKSLEKLLVGIKTLFKHINGLRKS